MFIYWLDVGIKKMVNDDPILAFEYIKRHAPILANTSDRHFMAYFKAWMDSPNGSLPRSLREKLLNDWNGSIREYLTLDNPAGDMFKYTCKFLYLLLVYKIIGV